MNTIIPNGHNPPLTFPHQKNCPDAVLYGLMRGIIPHLLNKEDEIYNSTEFEDDYERGASSTSSNDSVAIEETVAPYQEFVEQFFTEFQQNNDGWTKTTEGHEKLKKSFEEKMTSDIEFAKAIASYSAESEHNNRIRKDDSISPYSKEDGEEGEIKSFEFVIPVKLIKPLYNGQKEIEVSYEIISTIPSTIEEHWRPYTQNVNYCATFSPYFNTNRDGVLNLGTFVVTQKD